jgi:hypothetical protein
VWLIVLEKEKERRGLCMIGGIALDINIIEEDRDGKGKRKTDDVIVIDSCTYPSIARSEVGLRSSSCSLDTHISTKSSDAELHTDRSTATVVVEDGYGYYRGALV